MKETIMVKGIKYFVSEEEREELQNEIMKLLEEYDYNPKIDAVDKIIDTWASQNGWIINLFKNHPNYNGRYQISFDADFNRTVGSDIVRYFFNWLYDRYTSENKYKPLPYIMGAFSYKELILIKRSLDTKINALSSYNNMLLEGKDVNYYINERKRFYALIEAYQGLSNEFICSLDEFYIKKEFDKYKKIKDLIVFLNSVIDRNASEDTCDSINSVIPEIKAVAGQKYSRIVNKMCQKIGLDKENDYNRCFAQFADAINPLAIKRHTVLSVHPCDFLTMSFGNTWASCHTIDKNNKRGMENDYSGCYSGGTMSYMLDASTFVFYTVDKEYEGTQYELQPKINRCMFHMGEDKLIQGRVYPQANDGTLDLYKAIREIAQKVIADCLGVPNLWRNIKGISECDNVISSTGAHYRDYTNFSDCNVSYLNRDSEENNHNVITVGHNSICPNCGREHDSQEAVECESCYSNEYKCYNCGEVADEEDMHYIDGEWYCEDCCFYCEFHEEWETGDSTYIEGYGNVCDYAIDYSGYFARCENCGEYHMTDNMLCTEDETWFCDDECAINGGYLLIDNGEWYPEDEVYYCEACGTSVRDIDWDEELEMCASCAEKKREAEAEDEDDSDEVESESEAVAV